MLRTITSLLSYIGCIAMTLFVTYYLDGTVGIMLTAALICAFVISLALTLLVRHFLRVEIAADKSILTKGETFCCIVTLSLPVPLPVPVVEVMSKCPPHFAPRETDRYFGSLLGPGCNTIRLPFTTRHSGSAEVTVTRIRLHDFLGIFSFRLKVPPEQLSFSVSVYPDLPDIAAPTDFLRTAALAAHDDDEEEESGENALVAGTPGYDHRVYEPGDPLKRINWKLSSKRDVFLLRLDEQIRGEGSLFFLDAPGLPENEVTLTVRDQVIEGALTLLAMLTQEGRDASFFVYTDGDWQKHEIHTAEDVALLLELFAGFRPAGAAEPVPEDIAASGKVPICFTTAVRTQELSAQQIAAHYPGAMFLSALSAELAPLTPEHWTISAEFDFRKLSG